MVYVPMHRCKLIKKGKEKKTTTNIMLSFHLMSKTFQNTETTEFVLHISYIAVWEG